VVGVTGGQEGYREGAKVAKKRLGVLTAFAVNRYCSVFGVVSVFGAVTVQQAEPDETK
jgi:hypothetical protein